MAKEKKFRSLDSIILEIADDLPPAIAKTFLDAHNEMSANLKKSIDNFYKALNNVKEKDSIDVIRDSLEKMRAICEANPQYMDIYEEAKKEAKKIVAKQIAKEGLSALSDLD